MIALLLAACTPAPDTPVDTGDRAAPSAISGTGLAAVITTPTDSPDSPGGSTWTDSASTWTETGDTGRPLLPAARADVVVEAPGRGEMPFRDPELAVNGIRGAGPGAGSTDVFSIGFAEGEDVLVLAWSDRRLVDGPGVDLVVFENPFVTGEGRAFMDPAIVEVSPDGTRWVAMPHSYAATDPTTYSDLQADWQGFAGITPVLRHADDNPTNPFEPAVAGGDGFDLASLPEADPTTAEIRASGVVAVRITPAATWNDPTTEMLFPHDPISNGPDIDGVWGRWLESD